MKLKKIRIVGLVALLVAAVLAIALFGYSCVGGTGQVGWSGGAVSNGVAYVGSLEGRLVAVNLADMSRQWGEPLKIQTQSGLFGCSSALGCGGGTSRVSIYGTPVVSENSVYVSGYNGKVYAYNTINLAQRWVYPPSEYLQPFVGGLTIYQGKLFIGCSDGYIYEIDAKTGVLIAKYQTGDKIWGTPTVVDNTLYIGSFDKKLYAIDIDSFKLKWSYPTEGSIIAQPLVDNGVVYIGSFDKNLYAIDAATGKIKWNFTGNNWFWAQPLMVNGVLYAGCLDNYVYVINAATGEKIDAMLLDSAVAARPVLVGNNAIFASHSGGLYKIDTATRTKSLINLFVSTTIDGELTATADGLILLQTSDYSLQRVDPATGAVQTPISLISG